MLGSLLAGLALFAALEIALRVLTDYSSRWNVRLGAEKQFDPVAQFRNRPNYDLGDGVVTNELGYRAPRGLSRARPPHAIRILYLGDSNSVTPRLRPFPAQVEPILEAELGVEVETVNAAVAGYSSENALLLFEHELSRFDADHFFVYLGWNDLGQFGPEGLPYKRERMGYQISPLQRVLSHVYSVRFLYAFQLWLAHRQPTLNEPMDARTRALYEAYDPAHFRENLRRILQIAGERYPNVYLATLATITNDDPTEWELRTAHFPTGMARNMTMLHSLVGKYNAVVREVAAAQGVPRVDLYTLFDSREARRLFTDSCHMDAAGAARIARAVADAIAERERAHPSLVTAGRGRTAPDPRRSSGARR